jgi:hypothetical protein
VLPRIEVRVVPGGYELWMACASRGIAVLSVPTAMIFADGFEPETASIPNLDTP